MDQLEGNAVTLLQAVRLMEVTDPSLFAIQANAHGITLYPRYEHPNLTTWEKSLNQLSYPIPSEWTGWLSLTDLPTHEEWMKFSSTYSNSESSSLEIQNWSKEQVVAFSLNRLLVVLQEYLSGGHHLEVKSMEDVLQSICRVTSLNSPI